MLMRRPVGKGVPRSENQIVVRRAATAAATLFWNTRPGASTSMNHNQDAPAPWRYTRSLIALAITAANTPMAPAAVRTRGSRRINRILAHTLGTALIQAAKRISPRNLERFSGIIEPARTAESCRCSRLLRVEGWNHWRS